MTSKNLITLSLLFMARLLLGQDIEITTGNGQFIIDEDLQLIVCNNSLTELDDVTDANSLTIILNGSSYEFNNIPNQLEYGEQYLVTSGPRVYQLYFSQLALINISTSQEIQDEPKILASLVLADTGNAAEITSYCGIEYRGGSSLSYPKKSYDIELWEDETGEDTYKVPLLNMRNDDDWLLFAMYNEPLRLRSVMNHTLWSEIHTPYYAAQEEDAMAGISVQYVELAVNNEYMGVYALGEQIDRKQLQLKKYDTSIRGELYKGISWGASTFTAQPPYDNSSREWSGFEMKYPKENNITNWETIFDFVGFVINSTASDFKQNISTAFVLENAIDYFIFLNLLRATDNTGKNIFLAKYKEDEPYFYVPWDLDGSWGIIWNGEQENIYDDILVNGLYSRFLNADNDLFKENVSNRWFELRNNNVLGYDNLMNNISQTYNFLLSNANYERESLKWGAQSIEFSNLDYTYEWLDNRLAFLDIYFGSIILTTESDFNTAEEFIVFPNPVMSTFSINSSDELISYNIYNTNGTLVKKGLLRKNESIDIEHFSSGLYVIQITPSTSKQLIYLKVIKQ